MKKIIIETGEGIVFVNEDCIVSYKIIEKQLEQNGSQKTKFFVLINTVSETYADKNYYNDVNEILVKYALF